MNDSVQEYNIIQICSLQLFPISNCSLIKWMPTLIQFDRFNNEDLKMGKACAIAHTRYVIVQLYN